MTTPTMVGAYVALFFIFGFVFLFATLCVGWLVRPRNPDAEKLEIYECGEPAIGSSFVQFDLRFYVVALLFIIFDVEVAFFFPWATVFGKSTNLADNQTTVVVANKDAKPGEFGAQLTAEGSGLLRELGLSPAQADDYLHATAGTGVPAQQAAAANNAIKADATKLGWLSLADIGAFFAILMVGFAYVWRRGDLDWVRAISRERTTRADDEPAPRPTPTVLSA